MFSADSGQIATANPNPQNSLNSPPDSASSIALPEKHTPSMAYTLGNWFRHIQNPFSATTTESNNSHISIKNLRFRAGLEAESAIKQLGIGLTGEMLFSPRWGISAGLRRLRINNETYNNENDFNHKHDANFNLVYNCQALDTAATKIGMTTSLIQVPVYITYQLPIQHNLYITAVLGTDIDIYAKQKVYYHNDKNETYNHNNLITNLPVQAINNMVISAGVEKRLKHFIFQISPFVSPQIKKVLYKKEDIYAGIRMNILLGSERP